MQGLTNWTEIPETCMTSGVLAATYGKVIAAANASDIASRLQYLNGIKVAVAAEVVSEM
jgi:hypothetical protein